MPNVADELAALRAKGSVKAKATTLAKGAGLSTPEAEAAALKAKREKDKLGKSEAMEILNKGGSGAAQASAAEAAELTAKRKEELEKKAEASDHLHKGGSAGGYSQEMEHTLNQTGKKKAERMKEVEAKRALAETSAGASPTNKSKKVPAAKKEGKSAPKEEQPNEAAKEEPKVEAKESTPAPVEPSDDVPDLEEVDEEVPELETAPTAGATQQTTAGEAEAQRQITNRNEKKARKMMARLGMRPVPGIARATLKAAGNRGYFFIDRPDVFASTSGKGETYVMFGEARQGGSGGFPGANAAQAAQAQAAMAQQKAAAAAVGASTGASVEEADAEDVPELEEAGGGDEEGVEAKDIDLVMSQASCSRAKAVSALKENDGDLVNAIMSLTT